LVLAAVVYERHGELLRGGRIMPWWGWVLLVIAVPPILGLAYVGLMFFIAMIDWMIHR
jgi:fatty acid-binding protein DegV